MGSASEQNEFAFWTSIWPRLLPMMRLHGTAEIGEIGLISAKITPEEMAHQLMERGLPLSVLGIDVPELDEMQASDTGSNGSDAPMLDQSGDDVPPVGSNGQYFRG